MHVPLVMPGKQWSALGVSRTPSSSIMNIFVAFVSLTNPSMSSMSASSTFARFAWIFGKILLIKLEMGRDRIEKSYVNIEDFNGRIKAQIVLSAFKTYLLW